MINIRALGSAMIRGQGVDTLVKAVKIIPGLVSAKIL